MPPSLPTKRTLGKLRLVAEAFLVEAVRTPVGRRGGGLADAHPADLGAHVLRELVKRSGIDPSAVEDVIFGCLDNLGPQAGNIARTAWLAAGLPEEIPGVTIDRQCGSSQQAVHFAAQAVMSGTADLIVAGGVQNMSKIPIAAAMAVGQQYGFPDPFSGSVGWRERYGDQEISQFHGAELIAEKWDISREEMEAFALESHRRALQAIKEGRFEREITPYGAVSVDEGPRADTTLEKMAGLKTLTEGGRLTAALASQISDGAAAMLVASDRGVREHNLTPRARIHHISVRAADPVSMLTGPIPATAYALRRTGLSIEDIDLVEINEAFAPVVLAWQRETGADLARVNVNGGAIALGHPLGATGVRLMTTLLNELERTGGRYGLQTMCEGGGTANVTIIERL
jgi:acetyl-CoA C-acetyltransferase